MITKKKLEMKLLHIIKAYTFPTATNTVSIRFFVTRLWRIPFYNGFVLKLFSSNFQCLFKCVNLNNFFNMQLVLQFFILSMPVDWNLIICSLLFIVSMACTILLWLRSYFPPCCNVGYVSHCAKRICQ